MNKGIQASLRFFQKDREMQLNDLPAKARDKISRHLQKTDYEVNRYESTLPSGKTRRYQAFNRKQNIRAYFTEQGIHLIPKGKGEPSWHLEMTLSGWGYEGSVALAPPLRPDTIKASGNIVEYGRGSLTEWYVNDERGFEQGVTLSEPPAGKGAGPVVVEWTVSGTLAPRLEQQGRAIAFCNIGDESVLHYGGLKAWDATGRSACRFFRAR